MDMQALTKDLALIIHRHLKKQALCGYTGSAFRAEHPVSLGKVSLAAVLPHYRGHVHCLPVKMVKQVTRRIMINKFETIGLDFGLGAKLDKNTLRKEQSKDALTYKLGIGD